MSLFGALSASLTSLTSQSTAVNIISNNIANLNTTGFKSSSASFQTLVAGRVGGGVLDSIRQNIDTQGAIQSTGAGTDLALQGNGFFAVTNRAGLSSFAEGGNVDTLYSRAGSFRTNSDGNLVNEAGYALLGWPLDSEGRLPGVSGNSTYTRSAKDLASLVPVSTASITGTATPTSSINAKINLRAEEDVLQGAGGLLDPVSSANATNSATDIIIPAGFANGATMTVTTGIGDSFVYTYGGVALSDDIAGGIGGVTSPTATFTAAPFTNGAEFTITVNDGTGAKTFTYRFTATSNTSLGEFRNLNELSQIINATSGLRARVNNGILYIAGDDANSSLAFSDVASSGLVAGLGLDDDSITFNSTGTRFASLGNLKSAIDATGNQKIAAILNNPTGSATLNIYNVDPTDTITFTDSLAGDDLLDEFSLNTTAIPPVYDATAPVGGGKNMASGAIPADFSRTITVYTSLGQPLDLRLAFAKIRDSENEGSWAVELYASDPTQVTGAVSSLKDDGLIAYGVVSFNGDGTLKSVSGPSTAGASIAGDIILDPAGLAVAQTLNLRLGTAGDVGIGKSDGLSQFGGQYSVDNLSQNGFPTGRLQALQINAEGLVTAVFDNSLSSVVYKLPIVTFANPNGMTQESGNAFSSNSESGGANLGEVGDAGVGTIVPGALEVSTAEIGSELTALIVSQQAYGASANVLRKVGELFDELKQL
ncbi:MAG: flagellar hook-basal body complex protein [Rickettsiales bacterium]|nr:flagellar hook-basal body complex protein [Rickettsiales bacterium]